MKKVVLSEQAFIAGYVKMPKGFEIDLDKLSIDISQSTNSELPFSRTWDMLNTYVIEHTNLEHQIRLVNKNCWGDIYKPNQQTSPLLNIDPVDLKNSPDYTLLYGIKTDNCFLRIYYDDNRRAGRSWDIQLTDNMFIIFPSTNMYYIKNEQKENSNVVLTITYDYL